MAKKKNKSTTKKTVSTITSAIKNKTGRIEPLGSRVLIKPFTKEELEKNSSASSGARSFGIILPDSDSKEKSEQGKVIAVGPGEHSDGKLIPMSVKVGDTVAFSKYGYDDIKVDGEEYYLIKEENVLAIINN